MTTINQSKDEIDELLDKIILSVESDYLIIENRKRCKELLNTENDLSLENIIDVLISLHIILEVSLNGLFRNLSLVDIKKGIDESEVDKNLDEINFIHKTILFIYNSSFDFDGVLSEATKFHSIIGKLKHFAGIRNSLLHGHAIKTSKKNNGARQDSPLKVQLTQDNLAKQLGSFQFIMEGMQFYLNHLNTSKTSHDKEQLTKRYINDEFIPTKYKINSQNTLSQKSEKFLGGMER